MACGVPGRIVNVLADEKVLDEKGKIDAAKIHAFVFDQMQNGYYAVGEKPARPGTEGGADEEIADFASRLWKLGK